MTGLKGTDAPEPIALALLETLRGFPSVRASP
jgi:hypothetical protein